MRYYLLERNNGGKAKKIFLETNSCFLFLFFQNDISDFNRRSLILCRTPSGRAEPKRKEIPIRNSSDTTSVKNLPNAS
jgi:hypothetical protein